MHALAASLCTTALTSGLAYAQDLGPTDRLKDLSIEELANVQVTSVSRRAQPISEAPAAAFVITADDLLRAGVRSIPAALRLAPNLHVARLDAASYGITARGFNQSSGTANKLLVLVDGRIVYTPLFSGVFWDQENPLIEDLDRIEVVSGPGGTLWGANAVNGVINIVSRDAHETTGLLASGGVSNTGGAVLGLRYGAALGDSAAVRVYGQGLRRGANLPTEWRSGQGGFRFDWADADNALTLQGDVYGGEQEATPSQIADTGIRGHNLLGRWTRRFADGAALEVQSYIDTNNRTIASGIRANVDAAAVDAQYNLGARGAHTIVLGAGYRVTTDTFTPGPGTVYLDPASRTLESYHFYAQDTVSLASTLNLVLGAKVETNSYTDLEFMPDARLAWRPTADSLVWAAASRALRTPSRVDREIMNPGVLAGGPDFVSESLTAFELGYRAQPMERLWLSVSTFYNVYDKLRTLEASGPSIYPLVIRNGMHGDTYGLEAWGAFALTDWWRLNGGLSLLHKALKLDADSKDVLGVDFAGNDPEAQLTIRSLMNVGSRADFDVAVRAVDELRSPRVAGYVAVDSHLTYRVTRNLDLSLAGYNLLGDSHIEFINPSLPARPSSRSFFLTARWRS